MSHLATFIVFNGHLFLVFWERVNLFCNVFRFFIATCSDHSQTTIITPTTLTVLATTTSTLPASTTTITTSVAGSLTTVTSTLPPSTTTQIVPTTIVSQATLLSTVTVTTTGSLFPSRFGLKTMCFHSKINQSYRRLRFHLSQAQTTSPSLSFLRFVSIVLKEENEK
jgi:hypothetical protein